MEKLKKVVEKLIEDDNEAGIKRLQEIGELLLTEYVIKMGI